MDTGLCTLSTPQTLVATQEKQDKSLEVMNGRELLRTKFAPVGRDDSSWDNVKNVLIAQALCHT